MIGLHVMEILIAPWVRVGLLAVCVFLFPRLWSVRQSSTRSLQRPGVRGMAWLVRCTGLLLMIAAGSVGVAGAAGGLVRLQLEAAALATPGIVAILMGAPIARMILGPAAMEIDPALLKIYRSAAFRMGFFLILATCMIFVSWKNLVYK